MDEWDVDTVVVWFHSVGYAQFDASLREHQVTINLPTRYTLSLLIACARPRSSSGPLAGFLLDFNSMHNSWSSSFGCIPTVDCAS